MVEPVGPGITPGSGPGHLGLFGYDPEQFELGRGALSAAGLDFELRAGDVAARGNLATLDADGTITDRRAGRIPDPEAQVVVDALQAEVSRARRRGVLPPRARAPRAGRAARAGARPAPQRHRPAAHRGRRRSRRSRSTPRPSAPPTSSPRSTPRSARVLADEPKANVVLFRGLRHPPRAARASRPASGCGRRGRDLPDVPRDRAPARAWTSSAAPPISTEQLDILRDSWDDYDYFFLHHKYTDSAGEDGDRARKIRAIEDLDAVVPAAARALAPT